MQSFAFSNIGIQAVKYFKYLDLKNKDKSLKTSISLIFCGGSTH